MSETNEELVLEYQRTKSGRVFQKLMDKNLGAIIKMARSFSQGRDDYEDFVQEGWIAFERAAQKFTSDKKSKFITFATWAMKNQMIGYWKKTKPKFVTFSLDSVDEPQYHDKVSGRFLDLEYALGEIPAFQRRAVTKVYFSQESVNRSDRTMARMGRLSLKPLLLN